MTSDSLIEQLEALRAQHANRCWLPEDAIDHCIAIIRNHKPEPVSLEKCAEAIRQKGAFTMGHYGVVTPLDICRGMAKACLKEAGVAYVD